MDILKKLKNNLSLNRRLIFITGSPRSGTSMLTKVIDSHPDIGILMESIFENRRRHWKRSDYWNSPILLAKIVEKVYSKIDEPIVGNKVCTPDVWSADDIILFCNLFKDFKVVFIVRDPVQVCISRFKREKYEEEFNENAKQYSLLDFQSRFRTYTSSWRQSVEAYWKLKEAYPDKVYIVYYEDFCNNFDEHLMRLCECLEIPFSENMGNWYKVSHYDANGNLQKDLKYEDAPVRLRYYNLEELPNEVQNDINQALSTIELHVKLWKERKI